jgi:hypothetical protein
MMCEGDCGCEMVSRGCDMTCVGDCGCETVSRGCDMTCVRVIADARR